MSHSDRQLRSLADSPATAPARPGAVRRRVIHRITVSADGTIRRRARDLLSTEEPLEILVAGAAGGEPLSVTMRTPGSDFDLVAGYLFAEGVVQDAHDLLGMRYCTRVREGSAAVDQPWTRQTYNRVEVRLAHGEAVARARARRELTSSSCGVCGMGSIQAVMELACPTVREGMTVTPGLLLSLPPRLRQAQSLFDRTGGLHAAALFDAAGRLLCIREDVGRHNAMDKLVGAALLAGEVPLRDSVVLLSGRLSFELVQKAARAGIPVVAGISAPSTLAVELAERTGITLVGFLRENGFNIYAGGGRIEVPAPQARH